MNLTCSADANPAVDNYTLFEDDSVVNTSSLGVWSITMNKAGQFVYRCEANNSVGFGKSNDINVNVEGELRWQPRLLFYMFSFSLPYQCGVTVFNYTDFASFVLSQQVRYFGITVRNLENISSSKSILVFRRY